MTIPLLGLSSSTTDFQKANRNRDFRPCYMYRNSPRCDPHYSLLNYIISINISSNVIVNTPHIYFLPSLERYSHLQEHFSKNFSPIISEEIGNRNSLKKLYPGGGHKNWAHFLFAMSGCLLETIKLMYQLQFVYFQRNVFVSFKQFAPELSIFKFIYTTL